LGAIAANAAGGWSAIKVLVVVDVKEKGSHNNQQQCIKEE
jgi:hypothetical protein